MEIAKIVYNILLSKPPISCLTAAGGASKLQRWYLISASGVHATLIGSQFPAARPGGR
jgi:hypothetical protein